MKARVLVELFTYIENCVEEGTFYFKFSALHQLYEERLQCLGVEKEINRTRFKEQVLAYFPRAQEQSDGKHKILVFDLGMQKMMKQAMACDYEGDALLLAKAAKIVEEMLSSTTVSSLMVNLNLAVKKNLCHLLLRPLCLCY